MHSIRQVCRTLSKRGSALVLTLMMAVILAIVIAAMLYGVREFGRSNSDKLAYEENYHAAIGGSEMVKSWLMDPALAKSMLGEDIGGKFKAITTGSIQLTSNVLEHKNDTTWLSGRTTQQIADYYRNADGGSFISSVPTEIENGARRVLWEWSGDLLVYQNDFSTSESSEGRPSGLLLSGLSGSATGVRSKVTKMRITTPYRTDKSSNDSGRTACGDWVKDNLLLVSLIVDTEAKTITQGVEKTRYIQQKLLIAPTTTKTLTTSIYQPPSDSPPMSPGGSIVAGGAVTIQGSSQLNVYWGPIQVDGKIDMLEYSPVALNSSGKWELSIGNKSTGPGIYVTLDDGAVVLEKWLRWQSSNMLYKKQGSNEIAIFPNMPSQTGNIPVTDFFAQLMNGSFQYYDNVSHTWKNYGAADVALTPYSGTVKTPASFGISVDGGLSVYYDALKTGGYNVGTGGYVQNTAAIGQMVQNTINNDMKYSVWKQYAIQKNGYCKWNSSASQFVNATGIKLWVKSDRTLISGNAQPTGTTAFTNLKQISMKPLLPSNGNSYNITDQILFVDTPQGNPVGVSNSGTPGASSSPGQAYNLNFNSSDDFFWKGLMYVNGSVNTSGGGAFPTVFMQSPDEFAADPTQSTIGLSGEAKKGHHIANCYLDGILFADGSVTRTGNASVYGTLVSKHGGNSGGGPSIYYNCRNRFGLFQPPPIITTNEEDIVDPDNRRTIMGPIRELEAWGS